ncbi:MAG: GH92 family glycosyl hydrolase [Bacteroides sp.]|nr:GH92 family glycosyl hydrolase [Bacteroides sp.]MCI1681167.1 GH92 family glycosyl hydrolase [Bacteroides sp.]
MENRKIVGLAFFIVLFSTMLRAQSVVNYANKVKTMMGTQGHGLACGYLYPGASYPFGMVQFTRTFFTPDIGFSVNQLSGAGCANQGNFPTVPLNGELTTSPDSISNLNIKISEEQGIAGYYTAKVQKNIQAEFTVTERTGMARYTYASETDKATIIIGGGIASTPINMSTVVITGPNTCEGFSDGGDFCGIPAPYKIYFVAEFDGDIIASGTWKDDKLKPGVTFTEGKNSGLYFTFDVKSKKVIQYKIGISYVSIENARENLNAENSGWDFDEIKNKAIEKWNYYLGKIEVKGENEDRITQFYTHLYRALIHPSVCSDVNGEYMGADFKVHKAIRKQYTNFSNWDTYRTQVQLMTILDPGVASDVVVSLQDFALQSGGGFPRWVLANIETGVMQGDPTSILIANAYAFGARDYDPVPILKTMRRGAEIPGTKSQNQLTRPALEMFLENGFCYASMQLEYTSADFAISRFALNACNNKEVSKNFLNRAQSWRNLYNPKTGWLQSRRKDGWVDLKYDFREATYNSYFWMVPYNIKGLIDIIGGKEEAVKRLNYLFRRLDAGYDDDWYASGNEPSFGIPWVFNWVGKPYKTQEIVNQVITKRYSSEKNGLPGNDDLGSMGAWYVFATIGLYPEIPGVDGFSINSPIFPYIKMHLKNGDLVIKGGCENRFYIHGMKLNKKSYKSTWIPWNSISSGGLIEYKLAGKPSFSWGIKVIPPSFE